MAGLGLLPLAGLATASPRQLASCSVLDYRRAGDVDDSEAFKRALATGLLVRVPAGGGSGPEGAYLVRNVSLGPGARLRGDGIGRTVLRLSSVGSVYSPNLFVADSGDASRTIDGLRFADMTLRGWAREKGFSEHAHLLHLNGVRDVSIERVEFLGFQGDGLYLGSGINPGTERHNRQVLVRDCRFDGLNHQNRNAISILDGDGITIERCVFANCTRSDMPGAIDMEPNAVPFAVVRRIMVQQCRFTNIGGNVATIGLMLTSAVRSLPKDIQLRDNVFEGYAGSGAEIFVDAGRRVTAADPDMAIRILGNRGRRGKAVYAFYAAKGIVAQGNDWQDYAAGTALGYDQQAYLLRDARISDRFTRCGTVSKVGLALFNVANVALDGSAFIDCGDGGPNAYAIDFDRGASEGVSLRNVHVSSPTGRTRHAIMREARHRMKPASNREGGNDFGGLPAVPLLR